MFQLWAQMQLQMPWEPTLLQQTLIYLAINTNMIFFVDILIDLLNAILCVWNCDSKESIVTENK
jgi:hypothetical protein